MSKPSFAAKLIGGLTIGAVVATGAVMGLVWLFSRSAMGSDMSGNGWTALLAGTAVSFLVTGVLSTVLILGRRNGFDEGAHEIVWDTHHSDEES
jgi:ABC-type Fe3+-siderophore transport system permease subunit